MKKTSSHCRKALKQICDNLGEDLGSKECRAIQAHLRKCRNCSSYLDSLKKMAGWYRCYPTPPLRKSARKLPRFG